MAASPMTSLMLSIWPGASTRAKQKGRVLAVGGAILILATLVERLLAVPVLVSWAVWVFGVVAAGLVLLLWLLGLPSRMQASLLLDERLRLHERFSTTLALAGSDDPFARAARDEPMRTILQANLRGHFPIRLSRSWCYGAGMWAVAIGLLLYMPQKDLLMPWRTIRANVELGMEIDGVPAAQDRSSMLVGVALSYSTRFVNRML